MMAEQTRVRTEGVALKVILGMLIGVGLGVLLMFRSPIPIQAGDSYRVVFTDGGQAELSVAADRGAEATIALEGYGDLTLEGGLVGVSRHRAAEELAAATGRQVQRLELTSRGPVKSMPPITMLVYFVGEGFVRLLRMIALPLIVSSVLVGIAGLGSIKQLGRIGKQAFLLLFSTMFVAAGIGLVLVNTLRPGDYLQRAMSEAVPKVVEERPNVADMLLEVVPNNPFEALATFDVVGSLFFTILLGVALTVIGKHRAGPIFNFFEALADLCYVIVNWIMKIAPIGVACLVAYFLSIQDPVYLGDIGRGLGVYAITLASGLLIHWAFLHGLVGVLGKYSPARFFRTMSPAYVTAFGTASSNATIPVTMTCTNNLGVSKRVSGFVVPVGATVNMDGTALFEVVAVLFFAQAFGADLTIPQQGIVVVTAILAAAGAAGIPSAGLVTMSIVLTAVGLPLTGIGLLYAIDRPLDMMRTVVNVTSDSVASRIVQTWNPEVDPAKDDEALEYEVVTPEDSHG